MNLFVYKCVNLSCRWVRIWGKSVLKCVAEVWKQSESPGCAPAPPPHDATGVLRLMEPRVPAGRGEGLSSFPQIFLPNTDLGNFTMENMPAHSRIKYIMQGRNNACSQAQAWFGLLC